MMSDIVLFSDLLIAKLLSLNYVVHRQVSSSTNSIYIKIDYGLGRTIRVSDHNKPKGTNNFYYNVIAGLGSTVKIVLSDNPKRVQYFYPLVLTNNLINEIVAQVGNDLMVKTEGSRERYSYLKSKHKAMAEKEGTLQGFERVGSIPYLKIKHKSKNKTK